MKSALVLVVVLVLAGLAAVGGVMFLTASRMEPAPALSGAAAPAPGAADDGETARQLSGLRNELAHLSSLVADLQQQVELLESSASREAMPAEVESTPLEVAALAPAQIESTVKDVLEAEKQREEEERAARRRERDLEASAKQAERIAQELGLSTSDQNVLADHLFASREKRNELMAEVRENGFDREAMRSSFEEIRSWNDGELQRLFGADLAVQIGEQTNDWGRGGRRGGADDGGGNRAGRLRGLGYTGGAGGGGGN